MLSISLFLQHTSHTGPLSLLYFVLCKKRSGLEDLTRPKKPKRLPAVLTQKEVSIRCINGVRLD